MELILASGSPRRKQLLQQHGYTFRVELPSDHAEDGERPSESPTELVSRLAFQKAADVARRVAAGLVLGADTVAECEGVILGKPADREHARRMLQTMSGKQHRVLTGFCLWLRPQDRHCVQVVSTELFMEPMSAEVLDQYLDSGDWQGKAGAFGYQDGIPWVKILAGSESNVVGLPMEALQQALSEFGFEAG